MTVGVIIPAFNEAEQIGNTIRAIRSLPEVSDILVVDDGSTDETLSEALRAGARVVWHQQNYGKGKSLWTGFQSMQNDIIALVDADMGDGAAELRKLILPVKEGHADMTIALFPSVEGNQGFGIVKGLGRWGIRKLTGFAPTAPLSGQRVLRREIVRHLHLADGYGIEVAMTIDALRAGYRILEIPVNMRNREYGRTWRGFLHRGKQFLHVTKALIDRWEGPSDCLAPDDSTPEWR